MLYAAFCGLCNPPQEGVITFSYIVFNNNECIRRFSDFYDNNSFNIETASFAKPHNGIIANYVGLISLLLFLKFKNDSDDSIKIFNHNKQIINQMNSSYSANNGNYLAYYQYASKIANEFSDLKFFLISKEKNNTVINLARRKYNELFR